MTAAHRDIASMPTAPASLIKAQGWKGVMRSLSEAGQLVVTNHRQPEAVILSMAAYAELVRAASSAESAPLQALRERFDARLATLDAPDASERLRALMRAPAAMDGQVKAGETY